MYRFFDFLSFLSVVTIPAVSNMSLWEREEGTCLLDFTTGSSSTYRRRLATLTTMDFSVAKQWAAAKSCLSLGCICCCFVVVVFLSFFSFCCCFVCFLWGRERGSSRGTTNVKIIWMFFSPSVVWSVKLELQGQSVEMNKQVINRWGIIFRSGRS